MPKQARLGILFSSGALLGALLLLHACGGGGDDSSNVTTPPTQATVQGRLWHDNFALDSLDGTQIASPSGAAPLQVTPRLPAWPWPDGSQYATADATSSDGSTIVKVADLQGNPLYQTTFDGYLRALKPSPVNKHVILATWGTDSVSPATYVFYDLATHTILDQFDAAGKAVNWLPDGRYVSVSSDGHIATGTVGGSTSAAGSFAVPPGQSVNNVWANPQGSQLLMQLWSRNASGAVDRTDLWISALDGSNAGSLTDTHLSSYGHWSPDGSYVAFDVDTGSVCTGGGCAGSCDIYYVNSAARHVTALGGTASQFHVRNSQGADRVLGCEVLAWTR